MAQKMPPAIIDLSSCPTTAAWYTVVTNYNYEKKYAGDLLKGLKNSGLEGLILDVVVPIKETEYTVQLKSGKTSKKVQIEKVMPLYVFVKAVMNERVWDYLRTTTGAHTVLAAGGCPSIMNDNDILKIKDACGLLDAEKEIRKNTFEGKVGDKVQIVSGPFQTYFGTVKEILTSKNKAKIVLDNGLPVEVEFGDIEVA